jgi:hypothetical protein
LFQNNILAVEPDLVFNLFCLTKTETVDVNVRQMATNEIEQQIAGLEEAYAEALKNHADVHTLSRIWVRIKELKNELQKREEGL